jgi:hypothetical protein
MVAYELLHHAVSYGPPDQQIDKQVRHDAVLDERETSTNSGTARQYSKTTSIQQNRNTFPRKWPSNHHQIVLVQSSLVELVTEVRVPGHRIDRSEPVLDAASIAVDDELDSIISNNITYQ